MLCLLFVLLDKSTTVEETSLPFQSHQDHHNFRLTVSFLLLQGQNGFEELRRYVKQGSDFGKDLVAILQER